MKSLWFVVPVHGRQDLTSVCLRQLRRTCDTLETLGVTACAVIVGDDDNLHTAEHLGFATYRQRNQPLGRKWNDGYELACREGHADYLVPLGSDDWVCPQFIAGKLPADNEVRCSRLSSIVREDGSQLAKLKIPYAIGDGVRIIPRALLEPLRYRPIPEHVPRAVDTRTMERLNDSQRVGLVYHDTDPLQIVDFKSDEQLNSYQRCLEFAYERVDDPWDALATKYPAEAVEEIRALQQVPA